MSVKRCCDVRPVPAEVAKASAIEIVIPENIAHSVEPIQAQIICTTVKAVVAPADYPTMYRPKTVRQDPRLKCERLSVKRQIGGSALRRVQTLEAASGGPSDIWIAERRGTLGYVGAEGGGGVGGASRTRRGR